MHEIATPLGPALLHVHQPVGAGQDGQDGPVGAGQDGPNGHRGTLVLGHGAGGGIEAADLVAVAAVVTAVGWRVVLVEQPWRVAGKKVAPAPARLDVGWRAALAGLAGLDAGATPSGATPSGATPSGATPSGATGPGLAGLGVTAPGLLVVGGRSAGARVACRTALGSGAHGVVCLSFPLHPPGKPERSRAEELAGVGVPVLVVQGERDPFGRPDEVSAAVPEVEVVAVPGNHGLAPGAGQAADAVSRWLTSRWPMPKGNG